MIRAVTDLGMRARNWLAVICLSLAAAAILSGCFSPFVASDSQRSVSFRPYVDWQYEGQSLSLYLRRRTAVIISGIDLRSARSSGQTITLDLNVPPGSRSAHGAVGIAAAIEHNGYFLTASHCLGRGVNYLIYSDGQTAGIAIPRLVASAPHRPLSIDAAIIHIDATLPCVFSWSSDDRVETTMSTIAVGLGHTNTFKHSKLLLQETCLAGHVSAIRGQVGDTRTILSDLPLRPGDSGGPMLTSSGALLGVDTYVTGGWLHSQTAGAIRPDPAWVERTIRNDRDRRVRESQISIPTTRPSGDFKCIVISL
jgi:S1-C subfamily serine protease